MLVLSSRSAAPVTVALQLPQEASSTPGTRLVDKFPSTTSLWQILRRFESGVAGGASTAGMNYNFTQRAQPLMANGAGPSGARGAGRLCYELPMLNLMGRQFDSMSELSKTLQQLGISGSVLVRLSFKNTEQPLEEAMNEISQYFEDNSEQPLSGSDPTATSQEPTLSSSEAMETSPDTGQAASIDPSQSQPHPEETSTVSSSSFANPTSPHATNLSVFSAPTSSTPAAASQLTSHNEADYVPTAEHARSHQANLNRQSRNRRLPTDAEAERTRQERDGELSKVPRVPVRLRFPDQTSIHTFYGQQDTLKSIYETCRVVMDLSQGEGFELFAPKAGGTAVQGGGVGALTLLEESEQLLIRGLGWTGGVLVTVGWKPDVSKARREAPSLKREWNERAENMSVPQPRVEAVEQGTDDVVKVDKGDDEKGKKKGDKEARLKKLLGFGKK